MFACGLEGLILLVLTHRDVSVGGVFVFQAEDGIRDLVRSRGLGDVYKRQRWCCFECAVPWPRPQRVWLLGHPWALLFPRHPGLSLIHI